jgi:NAD(P)-dependent dehydrogenase (short-subunit alcohol dehydrogenase family)
MGRLDGKVVFIAGATAGIGAATACLFAREGAKVAVAGRRAAEGEAVVERITKDGGEAIFVRTDVTESQSVEESISATMRTFGRLNVLFNNAGGSSNADGLVTEASLDEFWRVIKIDLLGTFLCCRFAIPHIVKAGGGSVINNASVVGIKGQVGRDAYTAAKGGVIALTRSMAAEFVGHKVRVNALAPGAVGTERILAMIAANPAAKKAVEVQPLGLIDPLEIAHAALFLASDESRSITGEILPITGGR